jgi:hypothetical protein
MWACQDTMEAARQPGGYAACATAEFQARVELRGIHSVAVEPNGETHRILFTAGVEAFGIRSEILLFILLVAANRPKRFGLTLMRPTMLDSLEKPLHGSLIHFEVHANWPCPVDKCGNGARQVSSGTPKFGALK